MPDPGGGLERFGLLANVSALASLLACFAQAGIGLAFGTIGLTSPAWVDGVVHVQAVLMWGLGALAVFGLARDRHRHGRDIPLVLGSTGVAVMMLTLYTQYHWLVLTFAYVCVLCAVFLNQTLALQALNRRVIEQSAALAHRNRSLEQDISQESARRERLERLRRFLSPQVAELVVSDDGDEAMLSGHRRRIAVLFCDLRGFTRFFDSIEPEEAMELLQRYHEVLGRLVVRFGGTIDHRAGDGLMVIFNDPVPVDDPVGCAVRMAFEMRERVAEILASWTRFDHELGFGVGIAFGFATMGVIGYEGRFDYTANGNVVNLAARLCEQAADGQILVSPQALAEVETRVESRALPPMVLKGFRAPVQAYDVLHALGSGSPPRSDAGT